MTPSIAQPTQTEGRLDRMVLPDGVLTLLVKNVPIFYTTKGLLTEFSQHCDTQSCSMLHLPLRSNRRRNAGYAFITFTHTFAAQQCAYTMSGRAWSLAQKQSYCTIAPAHLQGTTANLTSFVLNNEKKRLQTPPLVLSNGQQNDFAEAVRIHCAESVLRELQRKCNDSKKQNIMNHISKKVAFVVTRDATRWTARCTALESLSRLLRQCRSQFFQVGNNVSRMLGFLPLRHLLLDDVRV